MSSIKKAFAPIVAFLTAAIEANPKVRVADILEEVTSLASAKSGAGGGKATTFHRDADGTVIGIKDYYFGLWFDPRVVEFGEKKSSASGYNTMSKEGTSLWTKQNSSAKKERENLLTKVGTGEIAADQITAELVKIEEAKNAVIPREDSYGFATLEELLADSQARGLTV